MKPQIASSSPALLEGAIALAKELAEGYRNLGVVGVVFLGAIVRGYFDEGADIDIAVFTRNELGSDSPPMFQTINGYQIHNWVANYAEEGSQQWSMNKRWAYSECQIYYDPEGAVAELLGRKVPFSPTERETMLMRGAALSEWYINELTELWVKRGSLLSAHSMFAEGLNHFFTMLFGLNNKHVPDHKWRIHYAERLSLRPTGFQEAVAGVLIGKDLTVNELHRRVSAFMDMWKEMLPHVEKIVGKRYGEFKDTI